MLVILYFTEDQRKQNQACVFSDESCSFIPIFFKILISYHDGIGAGRETIFATESVASSR